MDSVRVLIAGDAEGPVLFSDLGLSFWGGVDPLTGRVIDSHHPLCGKSIVGSIMTIPNGRGSCSGSCAMLELVLNSCAPAAFIFEQREDILPLGIIIAEEIFGKKALPVLRVPSKIFGRLQQAERVRIEQGKLIAIDQSKNETILSDMFVSPALPLQLSERDQSLLTGGEGAGRQLAMRIVVRMAGLLEAEALIDVHKAHMDGVIYVGPGGLAFAEKMVELGARMFVPTTLNSISVDRQRWRYLGVDPAFGERADRLAQAYVNMGAQGSFTCAPYLLDDPPRFGEQIVWAESNAVAYANSVIGARTLKYPGRAPLSGSHLPAGRQPTLVITVELPAGADESVYPLLGYHLGLLAPAEIPLVLGLEATTPGPDALKALCAAFATTSAAPMLHMAGVTPEAESVLHLAASLPHFTITKADFAKSWRELNSAATDAHVDLIAIGNPHASCGEITRLAELARGRTVHASSGLMITCGRGEYSKAQALGAVAALEAFGARFITDTCWCMIEEPIIPLQARTIMTTSAKYAHYAPGLVGRSMRFGSMRACVDAAVTGMADEELPPWLQ